MREIKFRFYNCLEKKIQPVTDIEVYRLNGMIDLMQYTGLKDKNGKEIYEGDIVRVNVGEWCGYEDGEYKNYVVKELQLPSSSCEWGLYIEMSKDKEVIGNIYENPDLLKV